MSNPHLTIAVFVIIGIVFPLITFFANWVLAPQKPGENKLKPYECGEEPIGPAWVQYNVSYYLFALIFVIFDVEVMFMIQWAVVFRSMGWTALLEMALFIGILLVGFAYAWKKNALRWE